MKTWMQFSASLIPPTVPRREFYKIGDVAEFAGIKPYVLRFWETEFTILRPVKGDTGQRTYRYRDLCAVFLVRHLLYQERYSLEGARKRIRQMADSEENGAQTSPSIEEEGKRPEMAGMQMEAAEAVVGTETPAQPASALKTKANNEIESHSFDDLMSSEMKYRPAPAPSSPRLQGMALQILLQEQKALGVAKNIAQGVLLRLQDFRA